MRCETSKYLLYNGVHLCCLKIESFKWAFLCGLPDILLKKLHLVQINSAQLVMKSKSFLFLCNIWVASEMEDRIQVLISVTEGTFMAYTNKTPHEHLIRVSRDFFTRYL